MTGSLPTRWIAFLLCGLLAAVGCSDTGPSSDSTGSLSLDLTVADGFMIDEVLWKISGGDMPDMMGTINTSAPGSTASVEVYGIPAGMGYLIEMEATSTDEELTCKGSANFDVSVGVATEVHVMLNCKKPRQFGGVRVDGKFNICAQLTKVVVSPLQTSVGNTIDLFSSAADEEEDSIAYLWSANSGMIADPTAAITTYTCTEVGEDEITINVSDDAFIYCMDQWTVSVTCVDGGGNLCDGVECPDLGECLDNTCNPSNGMCEASDKPDGEACGDGGMCEGGQCVIGDLCEGVTCPDLGECMDNTCDPSTGECVASDKPNGEACGDGGACMDGQCVEDLCADVTCPDTGNECTVSVCNNQTGECDTMNVTDGTSCDGGSGTCLEGVCEVGNMCEGVSCDSGDPCVNGGTCNPTNGQCEGGGNNPIDTPCDNGGVCDGNGICVQCNDATQCPADDNECTMASCVDNACGQSNVMDGMTCDFDGGTGNGVCDMGNCVAAADCTTNADCDSGDPCVIDTCVDATCVGTPATDGTECDFGGDPGTCESGICVGLCDGVSCDDGNQCTIDGTCSPASGQCEGGSDEAAGTACSQNGGSVCDGAGTCVGCVDENDCPSGQTCNSSNECEATASACGTQSKVVSVGCTNNVTTAQSEFPYTLEVTVNEPIVGGGGFAATFDGIGVFPEFFLDAAQAVVPGGVQEAILESIVATVQVRSGASGSDVALGPDLSSLDPGPTRFCNFPFDQTCTANGECLGGICNPPVNLATVPNSTDCAGVCAGLGKDVSQCIPNGFCVTGDLVLEFEAAQGTFTADASGEVLFGWADQGVPGLTLCPAAAPACTAAFMPAGCYDLPAAVFASPVPPIGIRVNVNNALFVPIQCAMAEGGGICASGEGCLVDADCATAPCTATTDVVCPTPDASLIACPIN